MGREVEKDTKYICNQVASLEDGRDFRITEIDEFKLTQEYMLGIKITRGAARLLLFWVPSSLALTIT